MNPELQKQFFQPDGIYHYIKLPFVVNQLKRVMGDGTSLVEGDAWKRKRRIMNTVFNYDFITSMVPNISRIFDDAFQIAEEDYRQ